jgi:hypothetical protein
MGPDRTVTWSGPGPRSAVWRCLAYSLLILERLVLCHCYRDNSFPGGVHVFLQRPSEIIKRLKCGPGVRSEIQVGSQRILERSIILLWFRFGRQRANSFLTALLDTILDALLAVPLPWHCDFQALL